MLFQIEKIKKLSRMKAKQFFPTSHLTVLAFVCITTLCFSACGGDDEPSLDDILSDKTTPVTFELNNGISYMFDYAGNRYIGSDTIEVYNGKYYSDGRSFPNDIEIELRQGQHQVIWFEGLERTSDCTSFNPQTKAVSLGSSQKSPPNVQYAECNFNVSEYLLPKQKLDFTPVTARVLIMISDKPSTAAATNSKGNVTAKIIGLPFVTSVELLGNDYTKSKKSTEINMEINPSYILITGSYESERILCPKHGLNDIQLAIEVMGKDGKPMATTTLPKISIRRGQVTGLYGPLFSGSTSDWQVETESYEEYNKEMGN